MLEQKVRAENRHQKVNRVSSPSFVPVRFSELATIATVVAEYIRFSPLSSPRVPRKVLSLTCAFYFIAICGRDLAAPPNPSGRVFP
jgi:hypothetical protein